MNTSAIQEFCDQRLQKYTQVVLGRNMNMTLHFLQVTTISNTCDKNCLYKDNNNKIRNLDISYTEISKYSIISMNIVCIHFTLLFSVRLI